MDVECTFVRDVLQGDDVYEMRLKLLSSSPETYPFKDDVSGVECLRKGWRSAPGMLGSTMQGRAGGVSGMQWVSWEGCEGGASVSRSPATAAFPSVSQHDLGSGAV